MPDLTERLQEMKREDWPRFRLAHIQGDGHPWPTVRADPELAARTDDYLRHWVPGECPSCGGYGSFHWGVVHGAGSCTCGWPGRVYHFILDDAGETLLRFEAVLWAHPYEVSARKPGRRRARA